MLQTQFTLHLIGLLIFLPFYVCFKCLLQGDTLYVALFLSFTKCCMHYNITLHIFLGIVSHLCMHITVKEMFVHKCIQEHYLKGEDPFVKGKDPFRHSFHCNFFDMIINTS